MPPRRRNGRPVDPPITSITVEGFKSIVRRQSLGIRPLTLLAGANSSGKSSVVQPLLLIKQTLDATFDPGPLRIDEPNVRFTSSQQIFSKGLRGPSSALRLELEFADARSIAWKFEALKPPRGLALTEMQYLERPGKPIILKPGLSSDVIRSAFSAVPAFEVWETEMSSTDREKKKWRQELAVFRRRCFLDVTEPKEGGDAEPIPFPLVFLMVPVVAESNARRLIHVPGIRGNRERTFKMTATGPTFSGTFENYVGSVVLNWQREDQNRIQQLGDMLRSLGLTWKVAAKQINDTAIEVEVARLPEPRRGGGADLVNLADVGLGVSQVLPVAVALLAAADGQLLYLEEPEIHLHPRAQVALSTALISAANRGVRVIVETHSDLLLRAIQTAVANGDIPKEDVILHWFKRDAKDGVTSIASATLDEAGAYGDWPEDFGNVYLDAEQQYIESAAARRMSS